MTDLPSVKESYQGPSAGYATYVVLVLLFCYSLSFVDRQILSLMVVPIKRSLSLSDTEVGLLQGFSFALFYTLMSLPAGRIADTMNRRNLVVAGVLLWSAMTALGSVALSFRALFLTRFGVGLGEAALTPAAFSMISDYFPRERLGRALSVYTLGVFLGTGTAFAVGGSIVDVLSRLSTVHLIVGEIAAWRATFLVVGVPGILAAILMLTIKEPRRASLLRSSEGRPVALRWGETIAEARARWKPVGGLALGMLFQALCAYAFTSWAPTFFYRLHGWTPGQSGRSLGLIVLTFGCAGIYCGGTISDILLQRGYAHAPLIVACCSAAGSSVLFPFAFMQSTAGYSLAWLAPAIFSLGLPIGSSAAGLQLIVPNQLRGQVTALVLFVSNLGGISLGPLIPGFLNDHLFHAEKLLGRSLALTTGLSSILMLLAFLATIASYRQHYEMARSLT